MSEDMKTVVQRVARLQQFATLFQQELKEINDLLREEMVQSGEMVNGASTSPEEMQTMLDALAKQGSTSLKELYNSAAKEVYVKNSMGDPNDTYAKFFYGKASLLVHHMSSTTIEGGRGYIRQTDTLRQYEESVTDAPIETLRDWPNGFYRDADTKETQFLIKISHHYGFIYDGLPGDDGVAYLVDYDNCTRRAFSELAEEEKSNLVTHLNSSLITLTSQLGLAV